jgi:[1-hydroxy-2-(trimethylamino)ethyl]phosphonate dioxygenase
MSVIVKKILALYESRGGAAYSWDRVSQTVHALQTAAQAVQAGASDALVTAALVHDIGHLLSDMDEGAPTGQELDDHHEVRGAAFLDRYFRPEIARVVGLHVAAKRYMCAVEPGYAERLSPDSVRSLTLQGGPLADHEIHAFERKAGFHEAVMLRKWDEAAKVPGLPVPDLARYRPLLECGLRADLAEPAGPSRWAPHKGTR